MNVGLPRKGSSTSRRPSTDAWLPGSRARSVPRRTVDNVRRARSPSPDPRSMDRGSFPPCEFAESTIDRELVELADQREVPLGQAADVVGGHLDPDRPVFHDEL